MALAYIELRLLGDTNKVIWKKLTKKDLLDYW